MKELSEGIGFAKISAETNSESVYYTGDKITTKQYHVNSLLLLLLLLGRKIYIRKHIYWLLSLLIYSTGTRLGERSLILMVLIGRSSILRVWTRSGGREVVDLRVLVGPRLGSGRMCGFSLIFLSVSKESG